MLKEDRAALALVEQPFMPSIEVITSDFTYIRLEGDRRKVTGTLGKVEIDKGDGIRVWAERIKKHLDLSMEVFVYFSKYYSGYPLVDAAQLIRLL